MTSPIDRARQLIALATNPGASVEEARTAAMAAARLISEHSLLGAVANGHTQRAAEPKYPSATPEPERPRPPKPARPPGGPMPRWYYNPTTGQWTLDLDGIPYSGPRPKDDPGVQSGPERKAYREGWDRIWGNNTDDTRDARSITDWVRAVLSQESKVGLDLDIEVVNISVRQRVFAGRITGMETLTKEGRDMLRSKLRHHFINPPNGWQINIGSPL